MSILSALEEYQKVKAHAGVEDANAYKLIQMLMNGALERVALARAGILKNNIHDKGANIGFAISIIDGLQSSLDKEQGGELADNLFRLYQYMMEQLLKANLQDSVELLDEVTSLMLTVKSGWDAIEAQANEALIEKNKSNNDQEAK